MWINPKKESTYKFLIPVHKFLKMKLKCHKITCYTAIITCNQNNVDVQLNLIVEAHDGKKGVCAPINVSVIV